MSLQLSNIKKGERLSYTDYYQVVGKQHDSIVVRDSGGLEMTVRGKDLIEQNFKSATQYKNTEKLGKNDLAEKLTGAGDAIFTVEFTKQTGEKRTLIGRFVSQETNLGRSQVVDLEISSGHNMRQVDHRTIDSLIVNGTKYVAK